MATYKQGGACSAACGGTGHRRLCSLGLHSSNGLPPLDKVTVTATAMAMAILSRGGLETLTAHFSTAVHGHG